MIGALIGPLLSIAEQFLKLRNKREDKKILERVIFLRKEKYAEQNKPDSKQDHAYIDNINNELRIIIETIAQFEEQDS